MSVEQLVTFACRNRGFDGVKAAGKNFPQPVQQIWKGRKIELPQRKWSVYSDI